MRAEGLLQLNQGLTLQRIADEFGVHLKIVEECRQPWDKFGLAELYEDVTPVGPRSGHLNRKRFLATWPIPETGL